MKIVFLEDDRSFADDIIESLQAAGHEVDYFESGRACLKAIHENQYDVALFDWEVPDMTGREVLESIKIKGSYPPVVFLTGRDAEEDVIAVIESGADDYIVKPVNPKVLMLSVSLK